MQSIARNRLTPLQSGKTAVVRPQSSGIVCRFGRSCRPKTEGQHRQVENNRKSSTGSIARPCDGLTVTIEPCGRPRFGFARRGRSGGLAAATRSDLLGTAPLRTDAPLMTELRLMPMPDDCPDPLGLDLTRRDLPTDPGEVLKLVHDLERQAETTRDPLIRRQLLRAGCELLDHALKEMHLPAA